MNYEKITLFLTKAKRKTYAGKGAETQSLRPCSHDLVYSDKEMTYYDFYFGGEKFVGEETLHILDKPFWAMNYAGRVIGNNFSGDFLKEALLRVPLEKPYRGPEIYSDGDYTYICNVDGDFEWFSGVETIYYLDKKIYECNFHGGIIK